MKYTGTIVEESLRDNRIINDFSIVKIRVTDNEDAAQRWHLLTVQATRQDLEKLSAALKPQKWYAHFWNGNEMVVVFPGKLFEQKVSDKKTWTAAIDYGLSLGIPRQQLDFLIE